MIQFVKYYEKEWENKMGIKVLTEERMNAIMGRVFNGYNIQFPVICTSTKVNIAMYNYFMAYVGDELCIVEVFAMNDEKIKDIKRIKLADIQKVTLKQYTLLNTKHSCISLYPKFGKKIGIDILHEFNDFKYQSESVTGILNLLAPYILA